MSATRSTSTVDYAAFVAGFQAEDLWQDVAAGGAPLNAAVACCDRHPAGATALIFDGRGGSVSGELTFGALKAQSERFAAFLTRQGVGPGDRVAAMLPRIPELLVVILGTWRAGAVYVPLFTAFGPKAIETRLKGSEARLVVTDAQNRPKLDEVEGCPPIALVDRDGSAARAGSADLDFHAEMERSAEGFPPVARQRGDLFLMLFTSGTTGAPKGVGVTLTALSAFLAYMRYSVDLRPDDRFWNIADPGWAYGLYYGVTGPLLMGHATLFCEDAFSVETFYRVVKDYRITNLAGAPTAFRLLMAAGEDPATAIKGQLRVVSSAGEPLNAEVIRWFARALAAPIYDHYGQTEMGMVLCNHHALPHAVHEGAAGLALPGYRIVVVDENGREMGPGQQGQLAIDRRQSPLMHFAGYWQRDGLADDARYYLTGDTAEQNDDGTISFFGRDDDVITSSGYRIGPFDVESALIEHPSVAETAVIGKPDPERTEVVKAFVILKAGHAGTADLAEELRQHVRRRLSAHAYPREIDFVTELPKTPSGKIQRFILRNAERNRGA